MRRGGTLGQRLVRSVTVPLAGGAAFALFVAWSQAHWWVGPVVLLVLVAAVSVLCRW